MKSAWNNVNLSTFYMLVTFVTKTLNKSVFPTAADVSGSKSNWSNIALLAFLNLNGRCSTLIGIHGIDK